MKNKLINFLGLLILLILQYFIVSECGTSIVGYGFYVNAIILLMLFSMEFILISLMLSFYGEYFFRKSGVINLIRFGSRAKMYIYVIKNTIFKVAIIKGICYLSYMGFIVFLYHTLNIKGIALGFWFNLTVSLILYIWQLYVEIRYGAKFGLLFVNITYIALTILGSILYEFQNIYTGVLSNICNISNRLLVTNYLYLERIKSLGVNYVVVSLIILIILCLSVFIGKVLMKKLDVIQEVD